MNISRLFCIPLGWMMMGSAGWAKDHPSVRGVFSDHAVLQSDMPLPVWGTAKAWRKDYGHLRATGKDRRNRQGWQVAGQAGRHEDLRRAGFDN
jgi:hypothetical protein